MVVYCSVVKQRDCRDKLSAGFSELAFVPKQCPAKTDLFKCQQVKDYAFRRSAQQPKAQEFIPWHGFNRDPVGGDLHAKGGCHCLSARVMPDRRDERLHTSNMCRCPGGDGVHSPSAIGSVRNHGRGHQIESHGSRW